MGSHRAEGALEYLHCEESRTDHVQRLYFDGHVRTAHRSARMAIRSLRMGFLDDRLGYASLELNMKEPR